jgi:hypothetical protein
MIHGQIDTTPGLGHPYARRLLLRQRVYERVMASSVTSQKSKRAAVRKALDRHKVYITAQSFSAGAYKARVLVDGEAYWVDEFRLSQLQQGLSPAELELTPATDD